MLGCARERLVALAGSAGRRDRVLVVHAIAQARVGIEWRVVGVVAELQRLLEQVVGGMLATAQALDDADPTVGHARAGRGLAANRDQAQPGDASVRPVALAKVD